MWIVIEDFLTFGLSVFWEPSIIIIKNKSLSYFNTNHFFSTPYLTFTLLRNIILPVLTKNHFFLFFLKTDKFDEEVIQDGARILIDKKAQLSLLGTEMDFVENKLSAEFVFNNPNIKGTCGCGESFSL